MKSADAQSPDVQNATPVQSQAMTIGMINLIWAGISKSHNYRLDTALADLLERICLNANRPPAAFESHAPSTILRGQRARFRLSRTV